MFRWRKEPDGSWTGVEGRHWFRLLREESCLHVKTNGKEADFRSLFRLDWDGHVIREELLAKAPELRPYVDALPGLRLMRPSSACETFFCFLCTPNNNVTRITSMVRHLASYGEPIEGTPIENATRFPIAERIAEIEESDLRNRSFGYRAATIPSIAKELVQRGGSDYLAHLSAGSYALAHEELCSFKGIGPKLADCICLFALDHTEAVPVDTHLWQAATSLYFPEWQGTALTDQRYRAIGSHFRERFGKLAGWAHQYLFYDNMLNWRSRRTAKGQSRC